MDLSMLWVILLSRRIALHTKFICVYAYHDKEQGNKDGPEDNTYETEHIHAYYHPENSDQRVHIAELFCQPESENIVNTSDHSQAKSKGNNASYSVAIGE
jgi:hypothetical protein